MELSAVGRLAAGRFSLEWGALNSREGESGDYSAIIKSCDSGKSANIGIRLSLSLKYGNHQQMRILEH